MATVNQDFQSAPAGRRVILAIAGSLAFLLVFFAFNFYRALAKVQHEPPRAIIFQALGPFVPIAFFLFSYMWERARGAQIRIEDNTLVLRKKRFPLEGLTAAVRDPEVLRGARRRYGSSGLAVIRGQFTSKRLGKFEAFLTDSANAVVLTWPDRVLAVSPADPEFFIYSARSAAGLR
jgi:hypothetical protein